MSFHSNAGPAGGKVDAHRRAVFLGPRCTGKTSLIARAVDDIFNEVYTPTIESNIHIWQQRGNQLISINIIDSGGLELSADDDGTVIPPHFCVGIDAYVLVYSVASRGSFLDVQAIFQALVNATGLSMAGMASTTAVILVGMKADVPQADREVTYAQGDAQARDWGCKFLECSARADVRVILQRQLDSGQALSRLSRYPPWLGNHDSNRDDRGDLAGGGSGRGGGEEGASGRSSPSVPPSDGGGVSRELFGGGGGDDASADGSAGGRPRRIRNFGNCQMVFEHLMDTCQHVRQHTGSKLGPASSSSITAPSALSMPVGGGSGAGPWLKASTPSAPGRLTASTSRSSRGGRRTPARSSHSLASTTSQRRGRSGHCNDSAAAPLLRPLPTPGGASSGRGRGDGGSGDGGGANDTGGTGGWDDDDSGLDSDEGGRGGGGRGTYGTDRAGNRQRRAWLRGRGGDGDNDGAEGDGRQQRRRGGGSRRRGGTQPLSNVVRNSLTISELYPRNRGQCLGLGGCWCPLCFALCHIQSHQISSAQQALLAHTTKAIAGVILGLSSVSAAGAVLIFYVVTSVPDTPDGEAEGPASGLVLSSLQAVSAVLAAAGALAALQSVATNRMEHGKRCLAWLHVVLVACSVLVQAGAFVSFVVGTVLAQPAAGGAGGSPVSGGGGGASSHEPDIRFFRDMLPEGQSSLGVFFMISLFCNVSVEVVSTLVALLLLRSIQPAEQAPYSYDDAASPHDALWTSRGSDGHVNPDRLSRDRIRSGPQA